MQTVIYNGRELEIRRSTYRNNNALAVYFVDQDGDYYGDVTKNLANSHTLPSDCAYVDENNLPGLGESLEEAGAARRLNQSAQSGFCRYFVYQFNLGLVEED